MTNEVQSDQPSLKDKIDEVLAAPKIAQAEVAATMSVRQARRAEPVRKTTSARSKVRMAFITGEQTIFESGSQAQQWYADLAQTVGELHVMVTTVGRDTPTIERPMTNVLLYKVPGRHTLERVRAVRNAARQHLRFNGVARPDVIVSTDPFVAGVSGWLISRMLARPWQVHLHENYFSKSWVATHAGNKKRLRLARFVLRRARSVRTTTTGIAELVRRQFRIPDTQVLPHLFNLSAYQEPAAAVLKDTYQHPLIIMTEGEYRADSALHDVFAATHPLLQRRQVALLVRGSGPAKHLFTEKVALLGVATQVIFETTDTDAVSRYQGADIVVVADTTSVGDEQVLRAVAAGTAVVAYRNDFREQLLEDGTSGFLCEPGDSYALGTQIRTLVNDSARRAQFAMRAKNITHDQLHEDRATYFKAVRDSIASVLTS